jgi:GT2 family glycosyltransferase
LLEANYDRLLERLPSAIHYTSQRSRYWLHLDHAIPVADKGIFLTGWSFAENGLPATIFCNCGEARLSVNENWIRHSRADVTTFLDAAGIRASDHEHGFTCYVPIHSGDRPYWVSVVSDYGEERRMHVPAAAHRQDALETVRNLLGTFQTGHRDLLTLMDRQIGPAVEAAWAERKKPPTRGLIDRFGVLPAAPQVSIIVPLYGRWDFAEYQISQFADDADFQDVDLIYVVDDPSIYDNFRSAGHNLFGVYGVPFTIVFSGANLGFAGANNFGAGYARGKFILLVNSDVFPRRPGWIRGLLEIHGRLALPALLGVKLIYEDGTLQHAGIEFRRHSPWGGLWINDHPQKGQMPRDLKGTHEVAAVTAACALIEADLYRDLNGFSEDYIIGDFEDSDLCLRARRAGRRNYVTLDVELYHLERQSQNQTGDTFWRTNLTAYNCWLHNKRWSGLIEEIAAGPPPSAPAIKSSDRAAIPGQKADRPTRTDRP